MIPLLVSTNDYGGAANACLRLHSGLLEEDVHSQLLLKTKTNMDLNESFQISLKAQNKTIKERSVRKFNNILKELGLYKEKNDIFLEHRPIGAERFSYPYSDYDITDSNLYKHADIINLHWVADFLDFPSFFRKNNKPLVWTLHDQYPFTGGEHYIEEYLGMNNGFPKKRKYSSEEKSRSKELLNVKKEALKGVNNLTIVAPSKWMANEARESILFRDFSVKHIPYGIDSSIFKPLDKEYSREVLDIPKEKLVILFVAEDTTNKRKGFEFLQKALEHINFSNTLLLSIGKKGLNKKKTNNIINFGTVKDELLMSILYSAADVFIIPSILDNLPNTVLESLMCGTPVIGFPAGGVPEMIEDGKNGYITNEISVNALQMTIEKFINDAAIFNRAKIRSDALRKYELSIQAKAYLELFKSLL